LKTSSDCDVSHRALNGLIMLNLKEVSVSIFFKILFVLVLVNLKNIIQLMHSVCGTKLIYGKDDLYESLKNKWVD
jgi:hypothetical protein